MEDDDCEIIADSGKKEPCKHIRALKNQSTLKNYALLHAFYVACIETNSFERKIKDCKCRSKKCAKTRIHACLSCVNFSCQRHIRTHAKQAKHRLFVDTDSGNLFCSRCKDYQYDFDFMRISEEQNFIAYQKRGAVIFQKEQNLQESSFLSDSEVKFDATTDISNGLINMNKVSCYMNVIVQTIIHAPIFRDYLLSCKHKCKNFQLNLKEAQKVNLCAFCEMINIVQKIFSGTGENYVLGNLLYPFWLFLKRYNCIQPKEPKPRDVQEFFRELLTILHVDSLKSEDQLTGDPFQSSSCHCIIHSIFGFSLGFKKTCKNCSYVHESSQVIWFMSLGLDDLPELSLNYCLKRYFQEEDMPVYSCNSCQTTSGCISKSYVKQLPIVFSFLLNTRSQLQGTCSRRQGARSRKQATNSETQDDDSISIKCTEFLDMSPYVLPSTAENQLECMYYLFSVLNRKGDHINGHFYCYVRVTKDKWILCDDATVTPLSKEEINFEETRMLFYHRQFVPYLKVVNDMVVHEENDTMVQEENDMVVQGESAMVVQEESDMVFQEESDSDQ